MPQTTLATYLFPIASRQHEVLGRAVTEGDIVLVSAPVERYLPVELRPPRTWIYWTVK